MSTSSPSGTDTIGSELSEIESDALLATPTQLLQGAWDAYGDRCCVLSSMQDAVLVEIAMRVSTDFPIVFLDTGYHFDATWKTLRAVEDHYGITVEVVGPFQTPRQDVGPGECCANKPALLDLALKDRDTWISGLQREQTDVRASASLVEVDKRGLVKVNPIAQWSHSDRSTFIEQSGVIVNPLVNDGYGSIGCEPCTSRSLTNADPRSGRWADTEKTECGIHL